MILQCSQRYCRDGLALALFSIPNFLSVPLPRAQNLLTTITSPIGIRLSQPQVRISTATLLSIQLSQYQRGAFSTANPSSVDVFQHRAPTTIVNPSSIKLIQRQGPIPAPPLSVQRAQRQFRPTTTTSPFIIELQCSRASTAANHFMANPSVLALLAPCA